MARWIRTNEREEAVAALEATARFLHETSIDNFAWRWVLLSLHIAAQGFMVTALRDSAGLFPLRDDIAEAWMKAYRGGTPYPREKLDSFRNLYKKVKRSKIAQFLQARRFRPMGTQGRSILRLCDLRDEFAHFLPQSWSLEVSGLPKISGDVLDFIEYLATGYRSILWHDETYPERIQKALASCRQAIRGKPKSR